MICFPVSPNSLFFFSLCVVRCLQISSSFLLFLKVRIFVIYCLLSPVSPFCFICFSKFRILMSVIRCVQCVPTAYVWLVFMFVVLLRHIRYGFVFGMYVIRCVLVINVVYTLDISKTGKELVCALLYVFFLPSVAWFFFVFLPGLHFLRPYKLALPSRSCMNEVNWGVDIVYTQGWCLFVFASLHKEPCFDDGKITNFCDQHFSFSVK